MVSAIQQEVQPHINEMKSYRSKLQNSIDAAKAGTWLHVHRGLAIYFEFPKFSYQWTWACENLSQICLNI